MSNLFGFFDVLPIASTTLQGEGARRISARGSSRDDLVNAGFAMSIFDLGDFDLKVVSGCCLVDKKNKAIGAGQTGPSDG